MKRLTVLFDATCGLCRRCREWLSSQPAFVELEFIPFQWQQAKTRYPELDELKPDEKLVLISDEGEAWRGVNAWIMCLWALREYREWSLRLANPVLKPFARSVCEMVSENRHNISRWFLSEPPQLTAQRLEAKQHYEEMACSAQRPRISAGDLRKS